MPKANCSQKELEIQPQLKAKRLEGNRLGIRPRANAFHHPWIGSQELAETLERYPKFKHTTAMLIELSDELVSTHLLKPIPLQDAALGDLQLKLEVWKKSDVDAYMVQAWRLDSYRLVPMSASSLTPDAADVEIFVADDFINAKLEATVAESAHDALSLALDCLRNWFGDKPC